MHGPSRPTFIYGGRHEPPTYKCLNFAYISNAISSGSIVKVNHLMKEMLQNFGTIL